MSCSKSWFLMTILDLIRPLRFKKTKQKTSWRKNKKMKMQWGKSCLFKLERRISWFWMIQIEFFFKISLAVRIVKTILKSRIVFFNRRHGPFWRTQLEQLKSPNHNIENKNSIWNILFFFSFFQWIRFQRAKERIFFHF